MQRLLDTTQEAMLIDAMAECVASDLDYFGYGPQRAFADALATRLLARRHPTTPDKMTDRAAEEPAHYVFEGS